MSPGEASEASGAMSWPDEDARGSLKRAMPMPFALFEPDEGAMGVLKKRHSRSLLSGHEGKTPGTRN